MIHEEQLSIIPGKSPEVDKWRQSLETMYNQAFEPEERIPFTLLWRSQFQPPADDFIPEIAVLVRGGTPAGAAWYGYMPDVNLGYLGYLFVDLTYRGMGLGSMLFRYVYHAVENIAQRLNHKPPRFTFWEVRIPEEVEAGIEKTRRFQRIRFYERLGAGIVKVWYPCPPIGEGLPPIDFLPMAITYPPGLLLSTADRTDLVYYGLVRMCGVDLESEKLARALASAREE